MVTRGLDSTFLHGVTRDSLLTLARDRGFKVSERVFDVREMLEWVKSGEAALSGTAAVLAGVGTLIYRGAEHRVADGEVGRVYEGKVARLMDFGAFVTILPGRDGLVHISQISEERVERVGDKLKEGDLVRVKVLEVDRQGRVRLSMRNVDAA